MTTSKHSRVEWLPLQLLLPLDFTSVSGSILRRGQDVYSENRMVLCSGVFSDEMISQITQRMKQMSVCRLQDGGNTCDVGLC